MSRLARNRWEALRAWLAEGVLAFAIWVMPFAYGQMALRKAVDHFYNAWREDDDNGR